MPAHSESAPAGPATHGDRPDRRLAWVPYAAFLAATLALLANTLWLNSGKLVYTLDDAYIHLAVAENILHGTYGVNLGEASAPSSSPLYPFLLAPFGGLALLEWMPLLLGFAASLATIALWTRIVRSAVADPDERVSVREVGWSRASGHLSHAALTTLIVTLLIPATNLLGVMFTGMEHSLQLFATALLIAGLVEERRTGRAPWWLAVAIVLGPLLRYENMALSLPAIGYLLVRKQPHAALISAACLGLLLASFSLFLHATTDLLLPASVLLKSGLVSTGPGMLEGLLDGIRSRLALRQGGFLALFFALLLGAAFAKSDRGHRLLAAWCAIGIGLHLMVGPFGYFERYELYIGSAALLTSLIVFGPQLRALAARTPPLPLALAAAATTVAIAFPYLYVTLKTPLGSNNIYEQQYQMHRFATEFHDGPVAVTDLGWVAFRNDDYVLDLWGLAFPRAAELRLQGDDAYMGDLAREFDADLAMLYGAWYPELPEGWTALAEMELGKPRFTPAESVVAFYSLDAASEPGIREKLREFGATLPRGVRFTIFP